jgi:hypothetical protein
MARFADRVLSLAEGGSMAGFVSSAEWTTLHPLKEAKNEEPPQPEVVKQPLPRPAQKPQEQDKDEQIKRQVGDTTVWAYYAKSAGILPILLLFLFTAAATIGTAFPRQY